MRSATVVLELPNWWVCGVKSPCVSCTAPRWHVASDICPTCPGVGGLARLAWMHAIGVTAWMHCVAQTE